MKIPKNKTTRRTNGIGGIVGLSECHQTRAHVAPRSQLAKELWLECIQETKEKVEVPNL